MSIFLFLIVVVPTAQANGIALRESVAQHIVEVLCPGAAVKISSASNKSLQVRGVVSSSPTEDVPFVLTAIPLSNVTSPEWKVYLFRRENSGIDEGDLKTYLDGGPSVKGAIVTDTVVVTPVDVPEKLQAFVPDEGAVWRKIIRVDAGDLIGDGTLQVLVASEALYAVDDPREFIGPSMVRLIRVPGFTELFSGITGKMTIGSSLERTIEIEPRDFRIVPTRTGSVNDIVELSRGRTNEETRFVYDGTTYRHFVAKPEQRTEEDIAKHIEHAKSPVKEKSLSVRVVNPEGLPIVGASIRGRWSSGTGWSEAARTRSTAFSGTTNANSQFSQNHAGMVTIDINAHGYYPVRRTWSKGQVPESTVTVVLEHATQAVPMFDWTVSSRWWKEWHDVFEFGVKVAPTPAGSLDVESDRSESDLWFIVETGQPYGQSDGAVRNDYELPEGRRDWTLTVSGQNGWELAPGPARATTELDDPNMREAPQSGFVPELHFDSAKGIAFFLHHADSGRYGKAYELNFNDGSRRGTGSYSFHLWGLVQEESSGTTSLNPMTYEERRDRATTPPGESPIPPPVAARVPVPSSAIASPDRPDSADSAAAAPPSSTPVQAGAEVAPEPQSAPSELNMDTSSAAREDSDVSPSGIAKYVVIVAVVAVLFLGTIVYRMKRR
ncbi:MAG: hypothetical protein IT365_24260 [Candidatus Hydrogenedentes bacterium]|nr:hypothetical protein [Candidatus Hydrogenedentota bacterium]